MWFDSLSRPHFVHTQPCFIFNSFGMWPRQDGDSGTGNNKHFVVWEDREGWDSGVTHDTQLGQGSLSLSLDSNSPTFLAAFPLPQHGSFPMPPPRARCLPPCWRRWYPPPQSRKLRGAPHHHPNTMPTPGVVVVYSNLPILAPARASGWPGARQMEVGVCLQFRRGRDGGDDDEYIYI